MNDEIKEWKTNSARNRVAVVLMQDGVSFRFNEVDGIVFTAPVSYVKWMVEKLMTCYGCRVKPIITEYER